MSTNIYMGCFDIYCFICGNSYKSYDWIDLIDEQKDKPSEQLYNNIQKKLLWLNKCTILLANNKVVHSCESYDCGNSFISKNTKNGKSEIYSVNLFANNFYGNIYFNNKIQQSLNNIGIFLHTDCWMFIKMKYGIELKFKDLPIDRTNKLPSQIPINKMNYGIISTYWNDNMRFDEMYLDKNIWMAYSPLQDTHEIVKIKARILRIISQLKLKKDKRSGPSVSATFYKNKDIKYGNNNKFWIKKIDKWTQMTDEIITFKYIINNKENDTLKRYIKTIPQIGEYINKPLYIESFDCNKSITFIGTDITIKELQKKLKH